MTAEITNALGAVFGLMIPELILGAAACVLFLLATFRVGRDVCGGVAAVFLVAAFVALFNAPGEIKSEAAIYSSSITADRLAFFIRAVALAGGLVLILASWHQIPDSHAAEFHACLLLITAGVCLTGSANDLVTMFLALELISIPTYVLLFLPRHDRAAHEAALKYFLLSIFSSALLLFGFSYLYGLAGTTNIPALMRTLLAAGPENLPAVAKIALVMVVAGLGFRITAVPFHFYAPDVYQGTPTVAAAMLAFVPKVAGFAALIRLLGFVWAGHVGNGLVLGNQTALLFYILAVVTMTLGNVLALLQDNLKRMFAYSSVAHAGYMLIGFAVAPDLQSSPSIPGVENIGLAGGLDAVLFYLVGYGAMTMGAFAVLAYVSRPERPVEMADDLAGLSRSHPGVAILMGVFLLSLIGIPSTAGFAGKFLLFFGALAAQSPEGHPWLYRILAIVGALNAAIAAWYYLRVLAVMYLRTPVKPLAKPESLPGFLALLLCAMVTLGAGTYPGLPALLDITRKAVSPQQVAVEPQGQK